MPEQLFVFALASVTMQAKLVDPSPNVEPDGGVHDAGPTPGQLSETVGFSTTAAPPGPVHSTSGAGHTMPGIACRGLERSRARIGQALTVLHGQGHAREPSAYGAAGDCVSVSASPSVSNEPLLMEVLAVHTFGSVDTVGFAHTAIGVPVHGF